MPFDTNYLTEEHLTGFEKYKYNSQDTSPFSQYVMHPFWNKVVLCCPKWVAPNLLTFSGFLLTFVTFLMFTFMDYRFLASLPDQPEVPAIPKWAFTLAGILLFIAYTLDGIDGKQARRTGSSGPLGELFDHGLDSITAALIPLMMFSIFGCSETFTISSLRMFCLLWNVLINFYLPHWEKYNTGVLFLPWGYDLSMCMTIFVFLFTGHYGHEMWHFTVPGGINSGTIFELLLHVTTILSNLPTILYNVYKSYSNRTGYMRTFYEAIRPLISVTVLLFFMILWAAQSPFLLKSDPRALYFLTATIFSNICCRLIVAQMSNTRCELFNWFLAPTILVVLLSLKFQNLYIELMLMYGLCLFAALAHIHYGTCVVRQMCRHFHINCFKIPQKSSD